MTRENRIVEKKDLMPQDKYAKIRKKFRKELLDIKKNRRISIGPHATFYFENFDTMLGQIQEMLYIEKGGDEQLKDELNAYNPLIPKGKDLIATLMFEIDEPKQRSDFLSKVGGIEEKVYFQIDKDMIKAVPEVDVDRTSEEGKASSVQFLHFNFSESQIKKFKDLNTEIKIGIDHNLYNHKTKISKDTQNALIKDFI
tara:strand:- start:1654 stop:2247 length:594 start_codon:yes stop_codon:yes gene_type:complete